MQFVRNGPDVPERLLQAHEDGQVVFFCGAGISFPARLPGFKGLVDGLYRTLSTEITAVQAAAIKNRQYDTAIGLLEGSIVGGRTSVRREVARILKADLSRKNATKTHEALLALSRNKEGRARIITTNFDRLFEEAKLRSGVQTNNFQAPLLPVPKNRWDGIVYLHGLLNNPATDRELDSLVLSSGDFGLAYLSERWAARFVTELFRNYTICFVGYSINDPVLRYMMDALAADRLLGEAPPEAFAFGVYSKDKAKQEELEWRAKNVTPILYKAHNRHALLHYTIRSWAAIYRDGVTGKEKIITEHAGTRPMSSTAEDDYVGRVLWAFCDRSGLPARRFADFRPVPPLDWLEPLTERRFRHRDLERFGVMPELKEDPNLSFSLAIRPSPYSYAPWMVPVQSSAFSASKLDPVMIQVARWLTRHLDQPKLLLWIAAHGGKMHPHFERMVSDELRHARLSAPMRVLWSVARAGLLKDRGFGDNLFLWFSNLNSEGLTVALRMRLRRLLAPRVLLRERSRPLETRHTANDNQALEVSDFLRWEIVLSSDHVHSAITSLRTSARWREALPYLLTDATDLLSDALNLMRELGGASEHQDRSHIVQPSIAPHPQNRRFHDWTALIELARDALLRCSDGAPDSARAEISRWARIPYPVFKRLIFFAAVHTPLVPVEESAEWLLSEGFRWLWSTETQREAIRLLVRIAPRLPRPKARAVQDAILAGPPPGILPVGLEAGRLARISDRRVWLLLSKYRSGGGRLETKAQERFEGLSIAYPEWTLSEDERDEFPFWLGEGSDWDAFRPTPKRVQDLVAWLVDNPADDGWRQDDWSDRCKTDFRRTAAALLHLSQNGQWITQRWREALQAWSAEGSTTLRSWNWVGLPLSDAPNEVINEVKPSLGRWLESAAKDLDHNEAAFFIIVERLLEVSRGDPLQEDQDVVFRAINHPVGQAVEAALRWWYGRRPRDNDGLRPELAPILTSVCDRNVPVFRYGRLVLASNVISLFRADAEWTSANVLPLFDWQMSTDEAQAAWQGFLWSPRIYMPLMSKIWLSFIDTAQHHDQLAELSEQYASLLALIALERSDELPQKDLIWATQALPEDGLVRALLTVSQGLEGAAEKRMEYWANRALPYLKRFWPKSKTALTPAVSEHFARICVSAGGAFSDAIRELNPWLMALEHSDYVVHMLRGAELDHQFPAEALAFLSRIVPEEPAWVPGDLRECLVNIADAAPGLSGDSRYRRLELLVRRHG